MLRIKFTAADLCRVRVARGPHPSWETVLSINSLQSPTLPGRHWDWRSATGRRGRRTPEAGRLLRAASALVPAAGNFPDVLTPAIGDLEDGAHWDAIAALPADTLRQDLEQTFPEKAPRWARALHERGRADVLAGVLREYHQLVVRPAWPQVHRQCEQDRARWARCQLDHGVDGLLGSLHPSIRWSNPVLETDYPRAHTIDLGGRGLLLVPTYFCWGAPVTFIDGDRMPMLVCPGGAATGAGTGTDGGVCLEDALDRLGGLIGATRARLLAELSVAGSTTELATRLSVTPAAISQHTRTLREAGLLTTCRFGTAVRHALTPLGRTLLHGRPGA